MDGFYGTIRGTTMDNRGIDYRERSPLVVPPKLDLPPPAAAVEDVKVANWPKDPVRTPAQGHHRRQEEKTRRPWPACKRPAKPVPPRHLPPARRPPPSLQVSARPINIAPPPEDPPVPGTTRPAYANDRNGTARIDPVYDQPGRFI